MNHEDIIRMAREAGFQFPNDYDLTEPTNRLERFAALVAAHEREECAKLCEETPEDGWFPYGELYEEEVSKNLAHVIRARGNSADT